MDRKRWEIENKIVYLLYRSMKEGTPPTFFLTNENF